MILRALARRVDVEHDHHVGQRQRAAELAREQRRARVEMRLEDRHQPPVLERARRARGWPRPRSGGGRSRRTPARRRGTLRRAAESACPRRGSARGSATARPCSAAGEPRRLQGAGGVQRVVRAGHREREPPRRATRSVEPSPIEQRVARVVGHDLEPPRRSPAPAPAAQQLGAVPHHDRGARPAPGTPRNASRSSRSERSAAWWSSSTLVSTAISTFRLSIERSDSSASTTSHSPVPQCALGRPAADRGADEPARVQAAAAQDVRDHRRGRRLAVGARHRDRALQRAQLAQQLRAGTLAAGPARAPRPARGSPAGTALE